MYIYIYIHREREIDRCVYIYIYMHTWLEDLPPVDAAGEECGP